MEHIVIRLWSWQFHGYMCRASKLGNSGMCHIGGMIDDRGLAEVKHVSEEGGARCNIGAVLFDTNRWGQIQK